MSGICGWFAAVGPSDPKATLQAMAARLGPHSDRGLREALGAQAALASAGLAAEARRVDGVLVAVQGRAVWSPAAPAEVRGAPNMAEACATAYRNLGEAFLEHLHGQFVLAIVDEGRGRGILALDRTGTESLVYAPSPAGVVFGTTTDALIRHPAVEPELEHQALYDYVHFHMVPGPESVFRGVRRLLPGQFLRIGPQGCSAHVYWQPEYRELDALPFSERKAQLMALLEDAVHSSVDEGPVGAFLSGGTDSSTIAGLLGKVTGETARTYSIGFDAEGYDETEYARIVARHFATQHREYYVTPEDVVRGIPLVARAYDYPFGNASAVPAYFCAQMAAGDGIRTLLAGDGGDELFGGNTRYAKQWVFSLYERVPAALRSRVLEPGLGALPAAGLLRKARSYVQQANLGMPDRIESYNLLQRLGPERVFTPEFLAQVDVHRPLAVVRDIYHGARADDMLNRMLALDLRITLADSDLRKVTRACDAAGVRVTFPFLQPPLLEFAQRIPPELKVKGTRLRYFYKRALAELLPREVITKSKHGFGLPFGVWMRDHPGLHQLAGDSLQRLRGRGIVRPQFIDDLTGSHVREHAAYYGTMVWVLMMLEQWLNSRGL